tara:strand:- start:2416 stop:5784 length:3369 start_codon:yes stop_codon:yes gene_type:complete
MLQENNLATCLKSGMKGNLPPRARQSKVAKTAEWRALDKSWKSLLLIGLNEIQIPDEDENSSSPMMRSRRGSRRRGSRASAGPMQWLPKAEEVLIDDGSPAAFRLAVLLIRKTLFSDDWDESWNEIVDDLREKASTKGVHPVWSKMAEATPILAQFAVFPQAEITKQEDDKFEMNAARIDPSNTKSLVSSLSKFELISTDATIKMALQKAKAQLKGKRGLRDISNLENLEGDASIISVLLHIHLGNDASDSLKELSNSDSDLADAFTDLIQLREGNANDWNKSRTHSGEDELSMAIKREAWKQMPPEASELSSEDIQEGLDMAGTPQQRESLTWWKISALVREDSADEALELLTTQNIESDADMDILIPIVKQLGEQAFSWLASQIDNLAEESLSEIVIDSEIGDTLRLAAARRMHDMDASLGIDASIDLFTKGLDLTRLAEVLFVDEDRCIDHPYSTLLVVHLLPAKTKGWDFDMIRKARRNALSTVEEAEVPSAFSPASRGLILMLDGAAQSDDHWVVDTLDKNGIKAFNNCKQALKDGGDGLADSKVLDTLVKSVGEADLGDVESRLFNAVIDTLRLNRASWLLQTGKSKGVVELLDGLLSGEVTAMPMMQAVRHLVLEYDIGLSNLVSWYQENDPQSPWHTLARAAVHVSNDDELNAARDYKRAGDHEDFDYEHKILLHRKALIHLAHAEQWSEAVSLLEQEPALKSALTKRFQLYLNVSHIASNKGNTDEATRLLTNFVKRTEMVNQEDQFGKVEVVERVKHSEEELDMLRNYPSSHSRALPREPFSGRVKAALNSLQRERRRNRHTFENRYAQAMLHDPSGEEIYQIAFEASSEKPLEGLMLLERAQNSGKFGVLDIKRLSDAERRLFATYRHNLPIKQRAYLRHLALSPLVIPDTNILIDELQHRISEKLGISSEAALDIVGKGRFHRILKHRAQEGVIQLWLPKIVQNELISIASDVERIRDRFTDTLVSESGLAEVLNEESLVAIAKEIISEFSTWKPLDLHIEDEADDEDIRADLKKFLLEHSEVYDEITAMKRIHSEPLRTVINKKDIYPEVADQTLMCLCAAMANRPLGELGSVLIATRDSDFALVARAIEERFGFGVIANSRNLNSWLR